MSVTPAVGAPSLPKGRRWKKVRYPGGPDLSACLHSHPDELPAKVSVGALSGFGLSLYLNRPLEPGTMTLVELTNSTTAFHCQVAMRVVSSVAEDGEHFLIEGTFGRELRNAEVLGLVPDALS